MSRRAETRMCDLFRNLTCDKTADNQPEGAEEKAEALPFKVKSERGGGNIRGMTS